MIAIRGLTTNALPQHPGNRALVFIAVALVLGLVSMPPMALWLTKHWFTYTITLFQGVVAGTLFSHVSLAAGWCALGPLTLIRRLFLSLAWLVAVLASYEFLMRLMFPDSSPGTRGWQLHGLLVLQWVVEQLPLWCLVALRNLRISKEMHGASDYRWGRYSVRDLMVLTAIAAVVLGAGRIVRGAYELKSLDGFPVVAGVLHESWIVTANATIAYLLIGATLTRYRAVLATCAAIAAVAVITHFEVSLAESLLGNVNATYLQSVAINILQSAWLLGMLLVLRAGGYRLACGH